MQCNFLTSSSGSFRSTDNDATYDSTWFISVEPNNTIWLTFSQFYIEGSYYRVKVRFKLHSSAFSRSSPSVFHQRYLMGLLPPVCCCLINMEVSPQQQFVQVQTKCLFNWRPNITDNRTGNTSRLITQR